MAKRSAAKRDSQRVEVILKTQQTVRLRLLKPVKLNITGKSTGQVYHFPGGGSELNIDYEDAQGFLEKRYGGCDCAGNSGPKSYFEIVA